MRLDCVLQNAARRGFIALQMPGQRDKTYPWPYIEGLRLDEAMNDLTILSTGLYDLSQS